MLRLKHFIHKLTNWEYWPQWLVYLPIMPVYLYYTVKARTPFFIVAANPEMENGGYIMESKYTIHTQLPQHLVAETFLVNKSTDTINTVLAKIVFHKIEYPFFCKPDIGGKGKGVVKVINETELRHYHATSCLDYLVQATIPYDNEIGVFYCRMPNQQKGFISGIVAKKPMIIVGNGKSTLMELILEIPRYYNHKNFLFEKYAKELGTILGKGEELVLSAIGNHARGSKFVDVTHKNTKKLEAAFDELSNAYNTFYFGRYDIKFKSWEDLYKGKNFSIVELNGSGSEPTHIYDSKKKISQAWKIIIQHWKILYTISAAHHRHGTPYLSFKEGIKLLKREKMLVYNS